MTAEQEAAETAQDMPVELPVMLLDREIYTRMPTPEQLLVWQRTVTRLTEAPVDASWTGSEVMNALERLRKIVDSLMVNRADRDWLDDQFLEGTLDFQRLAPFIAEVTTAFQEFAAAQVQEHGTRAERRAKPAKKAARKKASPAR
jgi:hypothetical protein